MTWMNLENVTLGAGKEQTKKEDTQGVKAAGSGGLDGPPASRGWESSSGGRMRVGGDSVKERPVRTGWRCGRLTRLETYVSPPLPHHLEEAQGLTPPLRTWPGAPAHEPESVAGGGGAGGRCRPGGRCAG